MNTGNIDELISLLNGNNEKLCIFLGAGVDTSSGGLLFNDLKDNVITEFSNYSPSVLNSKSRDALFETIVDSAPQYNSREILQNEINGMNHQISDGYKILLLLAHYNFIDAIITTNYFSYLEEAQKELNIYDYDTFINEKDNNFESNSSKLLYIKLHGDANSHIITHVTNDEIDHKPYSPQTKKLFISSIRDKALIFIGYSGNDTMVTQIFNDNIDSIKSAYWIAPFESDSPLVKILKGKNKYYFCSESFDGFMIKWGIPKLMHVKLNDAHPIFIESLLAAKATQSTKEIISKSEIYIERENAENKLRALKQVGFVFGRAGIGKTSVLRSYISQSKNQVLYIDLKNSLKEKAINAVIAALGFVSDSPFAFLHRLCLWYESQRKYITFIIDGIAEFNRNIDEMLLLTKLNDKNEYVSFIYSSRVEYINKVCNIELSDKNLIEITAFNNDDIKKMLRANDVNCSITIDYSSLMQEPYICSMICSFLKNSQNKKSNVFDIIESVLEDKYKIRSSNIHNVFVTIAAYEFEYISDCSSISDDITSLSQCELFNTRPIGFKYEKMTQYYLYCYLTRNQFQKNELLNEIQQNLIDDNEINNILYSVYKYIFTQCDTIIDFQKSLLELNNLLSLKKETDKAKIKFARECIAEIIATNEKVFKEGILQFSSDKMCDNLKYILITSVKLIKSNDCAFEIWLHFSSEQKYEYTVFILYFDRLCDLLFECSDRNEINGCFEYVKQYIGKENNLDIIKLLYILMNFDASVKGYDEITKYIFEEFNKLIITNKEECKSSVLSILKKYTYSILFNSGSNIEGDYSKIPYHQEFLQIVDDVLNDNAINEEQLRFLAANEDISNNMILFLLFNLTVVYSVCNDKEKTTANIIRVIEKSYDLSPESVDFILSCSFMALYQDEPSNRKEFTDIFDKICDKYETQMFEQPSVARKSTAGKFSEEFEKIFEDGFNPTAFLFYTAPIDKSGNALKKYSDLCETLYASGNHSKILKIVHAIGQMISIYPKDGFSELKKLLKYDEEITRKGIIRILAENLQRYPEETIQFIYDSEINLSHNEKLQIWGSSSRFLENRTFEQLHWSRLIYALSKNYTGFIKNTLSDLKKSKNLSDFISHIFEHQTL